MKIFKCILIIIIILNSCEKSKINSKEERNSLKVIKNDSVFIKIPNNWSSKNVNDVILYTKVENKKDCYFVILKNNQITYKEYTNEIFTQLTNKYKTFEYEITKLFFNDNNYCYEFIFNVKENRVNYKIISLIYFINNVMYDFSYKIEATKYNKKNYLAFYNSIFSFKYKNFQVIDKNNQIIKEIKNLKVDDVN